QVESEAGLEVFATNRMSMHADWAREMEDVASGVLAIRISDVRERYVLWFRPEVVRTVHWAGEPIKQVAADRKLHPRNSFHSWKETLRGQSEAWSSVEMESAREFRSAVMTISLRRAEEEAELSEARFTKLTQALPIKIFAVTDAGMLTYVNARWRDAGLGEDGLWFGEGRLDLEDVARCASAWHQAVAAESQFEEEVRLLEQGGGEAWNLVRLVPFRREGADRAGWIGACIDLTERKEREAAMRVTEKLTLTGRMTSFLAHEINNPLEAITNLLFLLRQDIPQDAAASSYFGMVDAELERISGTVKQTLRWNTQNSDSRTWFAVAPMFDDAQRLLGAKIRNREIRVETEGDPQLRMYGIEGQIRQVVAHLLSNALDAVNVGGRVRLQAERLGSEIEITVVDDGVGMSEEEQNSLFKPFYSTKGDLGNGLGLYISKEIAERHHGHFKVESTRGAGTTVRLRVPEIAIPTSS
ncbi:MAG: ATP-binding protein, partial [Janthinobacterium lividum]